MVYATGDTHGNFLRFSAEHFPEQKQMGRNDYVIICGDFGGLWDDSAEERYWLNWLNDKPFTTLWVDGNHENYDMFKNIPIDDWHGGKVQRIHPNILHLMRGQLYNIEGYTFFTMGGARSHDIGDGVLDPQAPDFNVRYRRLKARKTSFRVLGRSWWPEEMPSDDEYQTALKTLERVNWDVDYVLTHCGPTSVVKQLDNRYEANRLTEFLEEVRRRLKFHYWLFGHYHDNKIIDDQYVLLWEQIIQVL